MSRPFSDAVTMVMPELHHTVPMHEVQNECAWCGIRLTAIPDAPKPVFGLEGEVVYCHPGGCATNHRRALMKSGA